MENTFQHPAYGCLSNTGTQIDCKGLTLLQTTAVRLDQQPCRHAAEDTGGHFQADRGKRAHQTHGAGRGIGEAIRFLADEGRVPAVPQGTVISPEPFLRTQGKGDAEGALPPPPIGILEGARFRGRESATAKSEIEKPYQRCDARLFPWRICQSAKGWHAIEADAHFWGIETRNFALALHRSTAGRVALACMQA